MLARKFGADAAAPNPMPPAADLRSVNSLPRDSRDDRDGFFDTEGYAAKVVTAVTVVTLPDYPR